MNCFIEFLSDNYQKKLRLLAQGRSERYEESIDTYKNMFIVHWKNAICKCEEKCVYKETCNYMKTIYKDINKNQIREFFDILKNIYLMWIDAKSSEAIQIFKKLLIDNNLLNFEAYSNENYIYFKGRESNQVLTTWDMFHIPFNKRYLISNQIYSLTGQPIIYLGKSIIDIAEELEIEDITKFKVSTIQLQNNMRLYDLRNNLYDDIMDIDINLLLGIECEQKEENFFRIILSSVCSFRKKQELKGFSFCEEYVLPQLLAQIIKNNNYDGIIYYSTKKFEKLTFEKKKLGFTLNDILNEDCEYKENLALFTDINTDHVYDKSLYDTIDISVPIDVSKIENITIEDLKQLQKDILDTKNQEKVSKADKIVSAYNRVYNKMELSGEEYSNTNFGQLHLYHLYGILNKILIS
ncbi:hypothetical protein [Anaerosporobacter sp.]|uniref:hypothetical protein n=1 Tax=Anaerosporobacter sp. TaxID=1872529 RepID=UPI00286EE361|nr:hypothetical protein [Anaerosporobacter sp.]